MDVSEEIAATGGYVQYTCSGLWNGTGDFKLSFDGDIYLYMLVLSTDKIEALTYKYKTLFEQSERLVKIAALNFDKDGKVLEGSEIITTAKYNALISERFDEHGALKNTAGLITATDWETWLNSYAGDMEKKLDIEAFAGMFASAVEESTDIVKRAEVSAFVTKDENGKLESSVRISADQITLEGLVTANENFKILEDGSIVTKNATISGKVYVDDGGKVGGFDIHNGCMKWNDSQAEIRLGYDSSWIRHTCVYIKADMFSNAIAGLAPMGGSGIYGSCRSTPTFPDRDTMCAGYFDGDVIVNAANILVKKGAIQADKILPQNGWSGVFKGKTVTVQNGIITNVS